MTRAFGLTLFISLLAIVTEACTPPPPPPPVPTRIPSTPISTELAPVATEIPAGFNSDNPIQLVIVPADYEAATGRESELQDLLGGLSNKIALQVSFVQTDPEAMGLLCASDKGTVSAAWMSGFAYVGAAASKCGIPTLEIDRGTNGNSDTGDAGVVLINVNYFDTGLEGALESTFCRTKISDLYSWTIPLLVLDSQGINIQDFNDIQEMDDYSALVDGIVKGDCAVIGLPESLWNELNDSGQIPSDTVNVVDTSAEFPYNVMVFPYAAALEVIQPITDALLAIDVASGRSEAQGDGTPEATAVQGNADLMLALFGEGHFVRVQESDFSDLMDFVHSSGLDLGQLGQ